MAKRVEIVLHLTTAQADMLCDLVALNENNSGRYTISGLLEIRALAKRIREAIREAADG